MLIQFYNSSRRRRRLQAGLSLLELLIATAILAVIFIGIVPLFSRAILSNKRGAESSRMAGFLNSSIEAINQTSLNNSDFNTSFLTGAELDQLDLDDDTGASARFKERARQIPASYVGNQYTALPTTFWNLGPKDGVTKGDAFLGDEAWTNSTDADAADGEVLWLRDIFIYNYHFADVHKGTIDVDSQSGLVSLGNQRLFDNPIEWNPSNPPDIREVRVIVRSAISAHPTGPGALMALGHYKAF
ncbi:MAG: prepilin-type N-terminal cleavage/methylation domain-containing protein [Acidobacteriota bacterium]